ncbi:MAG: dockerin type I repeat-containing protein, partial [Firmicutes bacterium]|nr:dockerin type I repeat-containing protein [Bacillota bacterium]
VAELERVGREARIVAEPYVYGTYAFKLCYDPAKLDLTQVTCDYFEFDPESDSITEVGDGAIIIFNSMHDVFLDSELEGHQDLLFNIQFDVLDREGKGYGEFTDDMEVRVEYFNPEGGSVDDFTNENYKSIIPIIQNGVLQAFRWGDVWRTNRIDVKDAVRLLQYINHYHDIELSEAERIAADVTHDDQITIADLTKLLQYLVGYDVTLAPQ